MSIRLTLPVIKSDFGKINMVTVRINCDVLNYRSHSWCCSNRVSRISYGFQI